MSTLVLVCGFQGAGDIRRFLIRLCALMGEVCGR